MGSFTFANMLAATYCPPITASMGTLPSPPLSPLLLPPSENNSLRFGIYAMFCARESDHSTDFTSWISCFDPSNNTWNRVSSIHGVRENRVLKDFSMTSVGDSIFIIGGRLCRKERNILSNNNGLDEYSEVQIEVRSTVMCYNIQSGQWSYCAPLNVPRYNFACTVCDDKIYVAGGQCELGSARSTSSVEIYDPSRDEWTALPNMNKLRYKSVGVTWQGKVHIIGGFVHDYNLNELVTNYIGRCSAEIYNAERKTWDLVAGMWQLDVPPNQIAAVDDKLYSSGDCLNAWKGHIEAYDGNLNLWYIVEGSQKGVFGVGERLYITMAPVGSHLYFLAGYKVVGETSKTISIVQRFDTSARENAWTSLEPIEEQGGRELCSHCCVVTFS